MKKVNTRVSNITLTREKYNMKANWVVPEEMIDRENDRRAEWIDSRMEFWQPGKSASQHIEAKNKVQKGVGNPNPGALDISFTDADFFWIRGQGTGNEVIKNFARGRYYPCKDKKGKTIYRKCQSVKVIAWGGNSKGNGTTIYTSYYFGLPRKPTIEWKFEKNTATVTVKTDPGEDKYERYDTMIRLDFLAPGKTKYQWLSTKEATQGWFSTTSTEYTFSRDMSEFTGNLTNGKPLKLRCQAYSRGILGDNPNVNANNYNADPKKRKEKQAPVKSEIVVAIPNPATITSVTVDQKFLPTSRVKVALNVGGYTSTVKLQRSVGGTSSWTDVPGAEDNGSCKALYDTYGGANPKPGEYVYYRIESERFGLRAYSAPFQADCLYTAKQKAQCFASMKILKLTQFQEMRQGSVQGALKVVMAYTDSTYTNDGCELSWSEYPNAWSSNMAPSAQTFEGDDTAAETGAYTKSYKHTKTVTLYGFAPGTKYYLRMRRYRTVDGESYYSDYDTKPGNMQYITIGTADEGDTCGIVSTEVDSGLGRATLVIGVTEDSGNTGTEVSWSTDANAWRSNEQPSLLEATWDLEDAAGDVALDWEKQQTVYLMGLEAGKTYYVMARRFLDSSAGRSFGPYSEVRSFSIASAATSASIQCNLLSVEPVDGESAAAVVGWDGDHTGCEVSWSKDPNAWESASRPQTFEFDWQDSGNKSGFPTEDAEVDPDKTYYTRNETDGGYTYTKVDSPVSADLDSYYELAWGRTSTCYISDLDEGETYYVRARSYYDGGKDRAWSDYSEPLTVVPYAAPNGVVLDAPDVVANGDPIELFWSIDSEMEQTEWSVHPDGNPATSLATGTGTMCRTSIGPERYEGADSIAMYVDVSCGGGYTASNIETVRIVDVPTCHASIAPVLTAQPASFEVYADRADVSVLATCVSEGITMVLPDKDVEQLDGDVVWTASANPSFEETTWGETAYRQRLADAVVSAQADVDEITAEIAAMDEDDPKRVIAQNSLDAANARLAAAQAAKQADLDEHPADGVVYVATVEMPESDLYDGGNYTISVKTSESVAGLTSETVELPFSVDYAHKAADPSASITVVPNVAERAVRVNLAVDYEMVRTEDTTVDPSKTYYEPAPWIEGYEGPQYRVVENPQDADVSGYLENVPEVMGDVYDVYRKTQDGYDLIATNVPLEGNVYDTFAPFGNVELAYRVCMRTVDGSIAFRDYPYVMDVRGARFDWDGRSVELPWNVETSDSYAKSFEARSHADGSVNGYYDKAVTRTGTLSTETIKIKEQATLELVRALGNYPGACFCRTDKGDAFQCNADLSEIGISYNSGAVPVRFDLTKMELSQEFMVRDEEDVDNG